MKEGEGKTRGTFSLKEKKNYLASLQQMKN